LLGGRDRGRVDGAEPSVVGCGTGESDDNLLASGGVVAGRSGVVVAAVSGGGVLAAACKECRGGKSRNRNHAEALTPRERCTHVFLLVEITVVVASEWRPPLGEVAEPFAPVDVHTDSLKVAEPDAPRATYVRRSS